MKSILRVLLKNILKFYPSERGKYKILMDIYYKYLVPKVPTKVLTNIYGGMKMNLDIKEYVQAHIYNYGSYELPTMRFIEKNLKQGMKVLDIGANVGYHTLFFAKYSGTTGSVFSFEPEGNNIKALKDNITLNNFQNVTIVPQAASSQNEPLKLYLSKNENMGTHSTVYNPDSLSEKYIEIPATTVDSFMEKNRIDSLHLVKIDVEGAELDVLNGMTKTLEKFKPILIVELVESLQNAKGVSTKYIKDRLKENYGYKSFSISDNGDLINADDRDTHNSENIVFRI